ncbi:MAG: dipeptidyl aminopeptidase/acylaminoacyl peptidase [Hyphomicrobiaceae bacterium]
MATSATVLYPWGLDGGEIGIVGGMVISIRTVVARLVCGSAALLANGAICAQEPLTVPEALSVRTVANPLLGDGFVAFNMVVPRPIEDGPGGSYLHLGVIDKPFEARTGKAVVTRWLVSGKDSARSIALRPKSRAISYTTRINGRNQICVQSITQPNAVPFAETPSVSSYRWSPDGKSVAFTSLDAMPEQRAEASKRGFRPVVYDEDWRHISLWICREGDTPRRVTRDTTVYGFEWSPNGRTIACACAPRNTVDDSYMQKRLHLLDVESGRMTKLVDNPGKLGDVAFSSDDQQLYYISAAFRNDPHAGSLFQVAVAGGEPTMKSKGFLGMVQHLKPAGDGLLLQESVGVAARLSFLDGAGQPQWQFNPNKFRLGLTGYSFHNDKMAFTASHANHPAELFIRAGKDAPGESVRLTNSNATLASRAFGEQRIVRIRSRDGVFVQGMLVLPHDYKEGTRYPLVIVAHGGPESHFTDGWLSTYSNWGHLLAARGIVSWYPNYRSSTGYGVQFAIHDHGDPMGREFNDHLDAIAHFDKQGLIDSKRVGVGGGSYGGYTAAWAATKESKHFAAAVSFVPFVDIRTKWLTTDIPREFYLVHYQEKWPWQQPELMADRSPLTHAQNCDTPLLLLGGTSDPRVHPSQPHMLYRAVKFGTDTPVRYVQYSGEGHGNRSNVNRMDYTLRTLRWFEHYLLGDGDRRGKALPPLDVVYPK